MEIEDRRRYLRAQFRYADASKMVSTASTAGDGVSEGRPLEFAAIMGGTETVYYEAVEEYANATTAYIRQHRSGKLDNRSDGSFSFGQVATIRARTHLQMEGVLDMFHDPETSEHALPPIMEQCIARRRDYLNASVDLTEIGRQLLQDLQMEARA